MKGRRPRPDELELWNKVTKTTEPIRNQRFEVSEPEGKRTVPPSATKSKAPLSQKSGPRAPEARLPTPINGQPVHMDRKAFTKMKRGKISPEARIDLHGMTLDRAHDALARFLMKSHARGLRLVLVITGKGEKRDPHDPAPMRRGVLKRQVPHWFQQAPLAQVILQVSEAHQRHGGSGAYYVYLKRTR